jgi:cation diffusion facilitator CzcD-associated flavoprotein CzcO
VGKKNLSLQEKFKPHPTTYLALCVDEFPNFFLVGGPNGCLTSSSYLTFLDKKVMYVVEATKKLQRERLKSIVVKKDAVDDFDEYLEVRYPHRPNAMD